MNAGQLDFEGRTHPRLGNAVENQLASIMDVEPETKGDEDLLAARWLQLFCGYSEHAIEELYDMCSRIRKADIRRRRLALTDKGYPWSADEAKRRKTRSKQGPP